MTTAALHITGLHKRYRGRRGVQANDGIDLDVLPGHVVGLLGHNGAGKTTLVNQIVGLARPDAGAISVCGIDAIAHPEQARRLVSVQAQANVPISGLTPRRAIELVGRIRGARAQESATRAAALLDALDLGPWADTPAEKVSGGIARLTAFAMTAVAPGALVILDEPTNDVDPVRRRLLWDQIRALADQGCGVLLVTHNVGEAERVVDHLATLDHGRVLAAGTPAALTAPLRGSLTFEADTAPGARPAWPQQAGELAVEHLRAVGTVASDQAADLVAWAQDELTAGRLERYALKPASLEDVYISLVGAPPATATGVTSASCSEVAA